MALQKGARLLAVVTMACILFSCSTEATYGATMELSADQQYDSVVAKVVTPDHRTLDEATGESDSVSMLPKTQNDIQPPTNEETNGQYAANSREYTQYMKHLASVVRRQNKDLEDMSVTVGNKERPPEQFATPKSYQAYMERHLNNGYQKKSEIIAPSDGDTTVDDSAPDDLGESSSLVESPPGGHLIASPNIPAVYECARGRPVAQSSIKFGAAASRAIDGRTDGIFAHGSCTHTQDDENPWWRVDLGQTMNIQHLEVYNRADCCGERLASFQVRIGDSKEWQKNPKCGEKWSVPQGQSVKIPCPALQGQYVFVVVRATAQLALCEVKVYGSDNPGANAAKGMPATQSSTEKGGSADRAVDGRTSTNFADNSCTHTEYELNPWWKVDLGKKHTVAAVQIWNRGDCCGTRLSNFEVRVGDNPGIWTSSKKCGDRWEIAEGAHQQISCKEDGQYVWVVLKGRNVLTVCEVRVLTTYAKRGINLARNKPTEQSSTGYGGVSKRAVDGNIETSYNAGSCTFTHYDSEPWWRVDLEKSEAVGAVQIWNRGDCCGSRLSNFEVRIGDGTKWQGTKVCGDKRQKIAQGMRKTIVCGGAQGRYVYVVKRNTGYLNLCEVRVLSWKGGAEDETQECISKALGVETRAIKAGDMTASSIFGNEDEYGPNNGRLNYRGSSWQPLHEKIGEWLQVKLPKLYTVTAVATQGDKEADKWVTRYKVRYFDQDSRWKWVGGGDGKEMPGVQDRNTVKKNKFVQSVKATKVRFYPQNWKGVMAMRVEVFGRACKKEKKAAEPGAAPGVPCPVVPKQQCDGRRRRSLEILAEHGFGEGKARLWYADTKGPEQDHISAHSVYVSKGVDLRTEEGSIYAAKDLVAGKSLLVNAWPGFGHGSAELWFARSASKTLAANTLFLRSGDFSTQSGSIIASESLRAGKFLEIKAYPGFGDSSAQLWYSATGMSTRGTEHEPETVYLKQGNFATQAGSISSANDVIASRYLTLKAFPEYGEGTASFWYSGAGKPPYKSNTVYLKTGNLATEQGSIISKNDIEVGQNLRLMASKGFGTGEATLWYAKESANGYQPNTVYLKSGDFKTEEGNILASKNLVAGRSVKINAFPGLGSGTAELKFSNAKTDEMESQSLYLVEGDFRTKIGSIIAAEDLGAGRSVKIKSLPGNGEGEAELFYSHTPRGNFDGKTLYLKTGDFKTEHGSIHAGDTLRAAKYLEIQAFPGFGEGSVKLWHCNKDVQGFHPNSLYLQNGDFRTEAGSIHASGDLVVSRYLTIQAMEGSGSGRTKLWFSGTGKGNFRSNSLYLTNGDFHTELGSIHAAQNLHAGKHLKIAAAPGHGEGYAKLWHSKTAQRGYGADTLYLASGHFHVQKGSLIASQDIQVGRYVKIGAKEGYGTGSTQLWYSGTGLDGVAPHTVYVDSGDFKTQDGDIRSAKDVVAEGSLYGANLEVKYAYVPGQITAGHLYLGDSNAGKSELLEGAMEMLDTGKDENDVGTVLKRLSDSNDLLVAKNSELRQDLHNVVARMKVALTHLET